MGFPAGMQLATIAFGIPLTATGKEVVTNVTVKPTARLIWAATGQPLPEFEDSFTAEAGQLGQFQVPFVDQPGFIDSLGNAVTDFAYQVTASWQFGNARPITWSKNLKPLLGQTGPIDLDLVPDGPVSIPVTAPTAAVLGFNGRTGFITLQDSDLPARLSDAQLTATYGPVDAGQTFATRVALRYPTLAAGLAGDSTGDESAEWFRRGWDMWLAEHPAITGTYFHTFDPTQSYNTLTMQTGSAPSVSSTVFNDTFTRTASDILGTTPDVGAAWIGGAGAFSLDGASAVSLGGTNGSSANLSTTGGNRTISGNITFDTTAGATTKRLEIYHAVDSSNRVGLQIQVTTGGVISWTIYKQIAGSGAVLATGGGTPLVTASVNTVNFSLQLNGTSIVATLNGITLNGTLTSGDAAAVANAGRLDMLTAGTASANTIKVNSISVATTTSGTPQSMNVYNGSKAGSDLTYQQARLAALYPEPLDLLFISSCHNYPSDEPAAYIAKVQAFIDAFRVVQPNAGIIISSQNPEFAPVVQATRERHTRRISALRSFAEARGYGYLAAGESFTARPDGGVSLVRSDGVHPNSASEVADPDNGSFVWASALKTKLDLLASPSGKKFAPSVGLRSPQPQVATSQAVTGRNIFGIFSDALLSYNTFGISQSEDGGTTWVGKNLPAEAPTSAATAGHAKAILFKGNYYFQFLKSADSLPVVVRAAPVAGGGNFSWSAPLITGSTGSQIISTGIAADDSYIYWGEYGDPTAGPSVWRSADGTTWTKVLGPGTFALRHVHGIFPDPFKPGHVYLTAGDAGSAGYNYRSTDYGATWSLLPGTLGTNQAWQAVQVSFDKDWIYFGPDTTSNMSVFKADRATLSPRWHAKQSHRYLPVPQGLPPRRITDLNTTAGSATVTSATANFTSADVGSRIRTVGQNIIPIDAYIATVSNATTATVYSSKAATAAGTATTAILGGEAWGAMAYYGAVDPASGIYYFVSINGAAGGNVDGLFAVLPDGTLSLLDILTTSPDGMVTIANGRVYVRGFWRPLLAM